MALCIAGAGLAARLLASTFTLTWTHTVEKIPWEETWRIEPAALVLTQARIKGSGAGMEPPDGAKHIDGWYVWTPENPRRDKIVLRNRTGIGDWTLCLDGKTCAPLERFLGSLADPTVLTPCS